MTCRTVLVLAAAVLATAPAIGQPSYQYAVVLDVITGPRDAEPRPFIVVQMDGMIVTAEWIWPNRGATGTAATTRPSPQQANLKSGDTVLVAIDVTIVPRTRRLYVVPPDNVGPFVAKIVREERIKETQ
jgi:hypothetical protein